MEETRIIDTEAAEQGPSQALAVGTDLLDGKFKIDRQIGSGGFGITYLAQDIYLQRAVVIKECFSEDICFRFGSDVNVTSPRHEERYRKVVQMFMLEARSIAKLRHPNIVGVHQVFEENKTAYMVLDLIDGSDIMDFIEDDDASLSPDQVHEILVKMLDAIDLIHKNDLLHRDISPDNILLDKWGSPILIDFGAAREDASKKVTNVSTMLVVKDGYSPYEFYVAGGKQEPSSDLYALAATFHHLIAGASPPNSQERVASLANNEPDPYKPLTGRFPEYELSFLQAIDKAASISPKDRIQSAQDWLKLIEVTGTKVKVVKIAQQLNLSQTLKELIHETNEHVYNAPKQERKKSTPRVPEPVKRPTLKRPEWVEEFNRETREAERRQQEEEFALVLEAKQKAREEEAARLEKEARFEEMAQLQAEGKDDRDIDVSNDDELSENGNFMEWVARKKRP